MKQTLLMFCLVSAVIFIGHHQDVFAQGATTAGMNGRVLDADGGALPGATVIAVHQPTGSQFGNVTDVNGNYRLSNMNVGGPYTVSISFVGYETFQQGNVFLDLGQTLRLNTSLSDQATELEAVEIVAGAGDVFDGNRTGSETIINERMITSLPTVNRDLSDFTRLTPQANSNTGIDGAVSFGGLNNRYNSIFIDGAASNDLFGLSSPGTNGGQTGISPISIDALEQFQVVLSPYDVKLGGLAGAGINVVTRSGSNDFKGSVYYLVSNQNFAGKTPTDDPNVERVKLADFSNKTYGFRLGGPIIKNKLFFFVNTEIQRDETPQPFDVSSYEGNAGPGGIISTLDAISAKLQNAYGYDNGGFINTTNVLEGEKFLIKLDYNLSQKHKITARHAYTKADNIGPLPPNSRGVFSQNSGQTFPSTNNSTTFEIKSNFSNSISNNLIVGLTFTRDDRSVTGVPFPNVKIQDGLADIISGSERFSHANVVNQDVITITDNFTIYKGDHTITLGMHHEFFSIFNLFLPLHVPEWTFSSVDKFLIGDAANPVADGSGTPEAWLYLYGHEQGNVNIGDDALKVAADFSTVQLGFYVQDEYQVSDRFKLTGGLRVDIPSYVDSPPENTDFNTRVIPLIEAAGYDLQGAKASQLPKATLHWSPRIGFNYDVKGDKTTQVRGGIGIFTSRIPYVWPGGVYLRNGLTSGFTVGFNGAGFATPGVGGLPFEPDLNNQPFNNISPTGDVDLFAEDFKFPQILKLSIGIDQQLPVWGLIGTIDFQYTDKVNDVLYQHVNKPLQPIGNLTGTPDNRPIFDTTPIAPEYTYITLATNTGEGWTYSFTAQVQKPFESGFMGSVAYTYTKATSIFDGTVFINSSQWQEYHSVGGRNSPDGLQESQFSSRGRFSSYVSWRKEYADHMATSLTLFANAQSGLGFSYVYDDNDGALNNSDPNLDEARNLIFVPATQSEIILVDSDFDGDGTIGGTETAAAQWTALDAFINNDSYLSERRGQYAERNTARMPTEFILDFRIAQEFFINTGGGQRHTLEVAFDIFNFTNFINKNWGRKYRISDNQNFQLIQFQGFQQTGVDSSGNPITNNTPTFTFSDPGDPWDIILSGSSGVLSARWTARLGLRYSF